ncbi:MAG TPA: PAS domain S-box protein [Candidatus Solibacter sp.]|nr:PAS domain S-box protein [Candidatus Solibacter sp.]
MHTAASPVRNILRVRWFRSWPARYGFAALLVGLAGVARYALGVRFGLTLPFILFYPAVLLAALAGGLGPGLLATLLSVASGRFFFFSGIEALISGRLKLAIWPVLFLFAGIVLSALGELARRYQSSLSEFEWLVESLEDGVIVLDRDYRYVIANRAFQSYRDLPKEEIVGRPLTDLMDADLFASMVRPKLDECFQGSVVKYEKRYAYPRMGERIFSVTYFPIAGPNGIERVGCIMQDVTERKRADRALQLFRTLIEDCSDAVEVADPKTLRFLDVNRKACDELGYTREEMLPMSVYDVNPEITQVVHDEIIQKVRDAGFAMFETVHKRKDGSVFPVEVSLRCVEPDQTYLVAISRNISDRKKAELALRESEDRYRDLVQHSEDLVCTHDLDGRLLSVNPAPARVLGYSVEELLNMPMRELVAPEYRDQFETYLERVKSTGTDRGVLCVMTRGGERRIWEYNNSLRTEGVASPIVRGMAHDITERKRAEAALRSSEQRYRDLFEKMVAGVGIISMDGELVDCNDAWARMFGYDSASECRGTSVVQHYTDSAVREELLEELRQNGAVTNRELHVRRKDGSPLWLLVNDILLRDRNPLLLQATIVDITARKLAEAALQQSDERFRVALKDSPITVFTLDRDLRYTWIYNPRLHWQQELIGKTDAEALGENEVESFRELKKKVLETGTALRAEVMLAQNGSAYACDITLEPLFDSQKNIVGITGAAMDIARLRELADNLQDAKERLTQEKSYLEKEIEAELGFEQIVGQSPSLREVLKKAKVVAPTEASVLLLGETGTGKELVARAVHALSPRARGSFIKLNCAAVPSGLLESELFGHEKGAFTGAVSQKVGRLELADHGTMFLDEVGELPPELQPKLLRVLQDREFERLGGVRTLRVDVRIVAATNRDLLQDVGNRRFREDLYYRLNVFPIQMPPLRERRSDIALLVQHFVAKYAARMGKQIDRVPDETMEILQNWNWPGNVRELENIIERMVILSRGSTLAPPPAELEGPQEVLDDNLTEVERDHIVRVLRETGGVLSGVDGAASRLGIKRTTLQSMLKRFGIAVNDYRAGTGTRGRRSDA